MIKSITSYLDGFNQSMEKTVIEDMASDFIETSEGFREVLNWVLTSR